MHDADGRRHDAEIVERLLPPPQEFVPFAITLNSRSTFGRANRLAEMVDLHRVIDHQVDRNQRIDFLGIAAQTFMRPASRPGRRRRGRR